MRRRGIVALAVAAALVWGCLSRPYPERQRFVLHVERPGLPSVDAPPPGAGLPAPEEQVLRVGRVRVSPLFERRRFVYRTEEGRFEEDFFHEFFVPPGRLVQREVRSWLGAAGLFHAVLDVDDPGRAGWVLEARVTELYGDRRGEPRAVMSIEFSLLERREGGLELAMRQAYREALELGTSDPAGLRAGWTDALASILGHLEADLRRQLASEEPDAAEPAG